MTISSIKKFLLDEELRGAETGADKLKRINTNGDLVDTITWSEGSSGTLDRSKVIVKDNAKLRNWTCEFSSNTDFVLYSEDIGSGVAGKTEAEQIFSISGLDNYLYSPQRIIADKNYAYVISRSNALTIWDIRNKNNIQMVGVISGIGAPNYLNTPTDMVIKKNYAYITSADNALVIIDVSNPNNPTKVGHMVGAGSPNYLEWPESLYIEDNYAYIVTNYDEVLLIIDISDPTNPVQVGHTADGSSGLALCKKDNYVYTCGTKPSNYNDINVYDVSDPSSPILINTITHSKFCYKIKIHDGYLYALFLNDDIFNIYSLSDPTTPTLVSSLSGAGSPNYLDAPKYFNFYEQYAFISSVAEKTITIIDISDKSNPTFFCKYDIMYCNDIFVYGDYIYLCCAPYFEYRIIKWSCSDSENSGKESIQIPFAAWGGTRAESDSVQFTTTINFDNQNVVQAIYNLYTKYIGMDNKLLGCSSFFEDKVIGTLNSAVQPTGPPDPIHPEDPTISIKISVPIVIGTNDVLTITEGNTTEDITVIEGNTVTSSFPPVITLPVSPLTNGFTRAATVTWKKKAAYDPAYNFDREYHYCDIMNYCVSLSFDKQMTRLQALEVLTQHLDGFLFSDSWGVEKLFVFRPKYRSSVPDVTKTVNLKKPNPVIETVNLVNEIRCFYGYDYTNSKYLYEYVYPENDTDNDSFLRNGFKRTKSFYLPGVFNESVAKNMTRHKYLIWKDGLSLIRFNLTLKGLVTEIGDAYNLISEMPDIDTLVEIVGIGGIKLLNGINIELVGLDVEKVLNNWFLLDDSGMGTARVLW